MAQVTVCLCVVVTICQKGDTPLEVWLRGKHPDIADDVIHRVTVTYGVQLTLS